MPKEDKTKKKAENKKTTSAKGEDEEDDTAPEPVELEEVKEKKGEPDDNLKRRAEWFQKRTGG